MLSTALWVSDTAPVSSNTTVLTPTGYCIRAATSGLTLSSRRLLIKKPRKASMISEGAASSALEQQVNQTVCYIISGMMKYSRLTPLGTICPSGEAQPTSQSSFPGILLKRTLSFHPRQPSFQGGWEMPKPDENQIPRRPIIGIERVVMRNLAFRVVQVRFKNYEGSIHFYLPLRG